MHEFTKLFILVLYPLSRTTGMLKILLGTRTSLAKWWAQSTPPPLIGIGGSSPHVPIYSGGSDKKSTCDLTPKVSKNF